MNFRLVFHPRSGRRDAGRRRHRRLSHEAIEARIASEFASANACIRSSIRRVSRDYRSVVQRGPVPRCGVGRRLLPDLRGARGDAARRAADGRRRAKRRHPGRRLGPQRDSRQAVVTASARSEADAKQLASAVQIQAGGGKVTSVGPVDRAAASGGRSATGSTCRGRTISISTPTTAA